MTSAKFLEMAARWQLQLDRLTEEMHTFVDGHSTASVGHDIEQHAGSITAAAHHIIEQAMEAARCNGEFIP